MTCIASENIIFHINNEAVEDWTLTSSTAVVGYSANRLSSTGRKLTWRSTGIGSQWVQGQQITTGVQMRAEKKRGVAIINHNLETTGTFQIQIYDTTPSIRFNGIFNAINYSALPADFENMIDNIRPYKNWVFYLPENIPTFTMGRWRITCVDSAPSYYEIGRVIIGEQFQPIDNFYNGEAMVSGVDNTRVSVTYGGDQTSDNRPKHRGLNITPPQKITPTDITSWMELSNVVGKRTPFFVDCHPKTSVPPDFVAGEEVAATKNLIYQLYGTNQGDIGFAWNSENTFVSSGRMAIEEQA